ncbi:hypothetical protein F4860DRAFT_498003 [Xylaria cubensis]|nr:hypothetical protein F4860DRAFT_498003 [Xylaria cubensis]
MSDVTRIYSEMTGTWGWVTAFAAVLGSLLFLYPLASRIQRRNQERRPNGIRVISDPVDAKFDIVAVHGLGAHPEYTWTCDAPEEDPQTDRIHEHTSTCDTPEWSPRRKIHLLRCLLKESFPEARILSFAYNSDWLIDAPIKTAQQIGERLHDQLVRDRNERQQRLPIIFVGHSFGGIVIKQALCEALCASEESKKIVHDTSGILFLGTPHQGSPLSHFGFIVAWATGFLGSSTGLLFTLRHHSDGLTDLRRRFHNVYRSLVDPKIHSICETKPSYAGRYLSLGLIVDRDSAEGPATKVVDIDTDHSGLNKCPRPSGELYNAIVDAIKEMRRPSLLQRGDKQIRDSYTPERLNIERLSGSILPMSQCYINLAIVQTDEFGQPSLRISLLERLNIEEPDKDLHVGLFNLFEPRIIHGKEKRRPQRILIRGRPGVGKTTLCKKIVHDFIHRQQWNDLFTRLLWIPLRNLDSYQGGYNITNLLREEYFPDEESSVINEIYQELQKHDAGGSLFLLDGLDEIRQHLSHGGNLYRLVKELLKQPNVIVTSRPSVQISEEEYGRFDLELETIGFYSDQAYEYVQQVTKKDETTEWVEKSQKINNFISQHPLIGDLVRIPIQLDALCFAWDDVSSKEPQTMTDLYQAIERGLWKKDAARLDGEFSIKTFHRGEIEHHVGDEIMLLEKLAFVGLYKNLTVFDAKALGTLSQDLAMRGGKTIDETLQSLSFLRSSDVSSNNGSRHYYFLHLTLQEYFAARYLTRKWVEGDLFKLPGTKENLDATAFLCRYKYLEKYDIVWRFMAGILSSDSECQARFFQVIQTQEVDLLGPAHQRLLMRCWFEIPVSDDSLRKEFENQLSEWLGFEYELLQTDSYNYLYKGILAKEMEVPTGVLSKLFRESGVGLKTYLMNSINPRRVVSTDIPQMAISWLKDPPNEGLVSTVLPYLLVRLRTLLDGHLQVTQQMLEESDSNALQGDTSALGELKLILRAIISQLENSNLKVRKATMSVLERESYRQDPIFPDPILQAVVDRLEDLDSGIRQAATRILVQSNLGKPIIWAVIDKLNCLNFEDRQSVLRDLKWHSNPRDPKLQEIINRFEDSDSDQNVRRPPMCALEERSDLQDSYELESTSNSWGTLHSNIQEPSIQVRQERSNLQDLEHQALADMLDDPEFDQWVALSVLDKTSNLSEPILEIIAAKLENSNSDIQKAALAFFKLKSYVSEPILEIIAAKLENSNSDIQKAALAVLEEQSNLKEPILQAVIDRLEDLDFYVMWEAVEVLKAQSHLSQPILKAIADKLENSSPGVQDAAAAILEERSNLKEPILQAIVRKLKDSEYYNRCAAIRALGGQSDLEVQILQAVIHRLADSNSTVQEYALRTLEKQSNLPDSVFPAVSSIFKRWPLSKLNDFDSNLLSILKKSPKLTLATFDCHEKFKGLFLFLLRKSLVCHLVWYHYDNKLHLVINDEVVQYEGEDPRYIIEEAVPDLPGGKQSRYKPTEES